LRNIALLLSILFVIGCASGYTHSVVNIGNKLLYGVEIECNGRSFGHGYLPKGGEAGYSGSFKISKNDKVTVSWGLDENSRYHEDLYIERSTIFKDVVFILDGQHVAVEYE
jgi:hypothetical protein